MRPLRIEISGLRSFRGAQTIDFSELGLFALVGDTGSGKSSILEAMVYALYNATSWSERDVRTLIASNSDTMKVVFEFEAGGSTYRVTRSTSHAPGRPPLHALRSLSDAAYRADGESAVNAEIERIVGLDYSTFCKTVVLPQGRFAELLLAKESERQRILGDLLGLDTADRLREALEPAREEARALRSRLDGARAELGDDLSERLRMLQDECAAAIDIVRAFDRTAVELREVLPRCHAAAESEAAAERVGASLPALDEPITVLRRLHENEASLAQAVASAQARRQEAEAAVERTAEAVQRLREGGRDVAEMTRHRETFNHLRSERASLAGDAADLAALSERLTAQRASLDEANIVRKDLLLRADEAESASRAGAERHAASREECRRAGEAWIRLEALRGAVRDADRQLAELARRERDATAARAPAQQAAEKAAHLAREAHRVLEEAQSANAVAAVAHGLHPGDRCPVCVRPLPKTFTAPSDADLGPLQAACKSADRARDRATKDLAVAEAAAETAIGALAEARSKKGQLARRLADTETAVRAIGADPSASTEAAAMVALRARERSLGEIAREAAACRDAARSGADRAVSSIDEQERAYHDQRREATSAAHRIDVRRKRWDEARTSLPQEYRPSVDDGDEAYSTMFRRLEQAVEDAKSSENDSRAALLEHQKAQRDAYDAETRYRREVIDPEVVARHALDNAIARIVGADTDRLLPASPVRIGDGLAASVVWANAVSSWSAEACPLLAERATASAAERVALEDRVSSLLARHDVTSQERFELARGNAQTRAGGAQTRVAAMQETVRRAEALDAQRRDLAPLEHVLNALGTYLQARSFKEWLMRRRESTLLGLATEILRKMTRGRYAFAARFRIVDGNSGLERSPHTLSGGETFLGSLALALAVVEVTSRTGGKIEAMFLDEGFGTLDAAALDEALSELADRASGGHLIGVVTHVRGVAEIIETVLRVRRLAGGSVVERLDAVERAAYLEDELAAGLLGDAGDSGSTA